MLNWIIHFSLKNRMLIFLATVVLLVAGIFVTINSEIDVFPDLNAPTVVVMTEAPGYAPEEIERSVTFAIETVMNGATGVRRVRSSSTTGFSIVWVEFDWDTDIYRARQIVAEKLSIASADFPEGVGTPVLGPISSILGEMLIVGLTADSTSLNDLRTIADRTIRPRLLALGGISEAQVIGGGVKEYQITLDPERMRQYGVTLSEVISATEGINTNVGGGVLYQYGNEYIIKGAISSTDLSQLGLSAVKNSEGVTVMLADIATVAEGIKSPQLGLASEKATPAVLLTITKQPDADTNELTAAIEKSLAEIEHNLQPDINISTDTFRQSRFIVSSISNIQRSLIEGAIFVVIILSIFLMNWRTTIISLIAMPLSIVIAMLILSLMGYSINTMVLGGIAIAIGSLVDDAIVDVENVYKRVNQNRVLPDDQRQPLLKVVFSASTEVRMPIFNSSLIIIASFVPLFFLSGMEGRMLIPLGVAFIVALLASTLVALTLTPVLCSYLLTTSKDKSDHESWTTRHIKNAYCRALSWSMTHRKVLLSVTGCLLVLAAVVMLTLGRSFLPPFNEGSFTINVSLMPGVSLEESDKIATLAEEIILSMPEIQTESRKTGRAELAEHALGVNGSEIEAPYDRDGRTKAELTRELRQKLAVIPGANIEIGQPITHRIDAMLSGSQAQIAIKIFGDNLNTLYRLGNAVKSNISTINGIVDVNLEQQVSRPQLHIKPRRELLARYGITMADFRKFVEVALAGEVVSQVYDDGMPYDLTLRVADSNRNSFEAISSMPIDSDQGPIPLSTVADIVSTDGPNTINRENVSRRIVVTANVDGRDLHSAVSEIQELVADKITLPTGYYISYGGQFESEARASRTLALASLVALLIVIVLLYHQFHNITQSLIILINLPLAMIGGVLILFFSSAELNIPAIIGFISLLGITTRNGMLLISRYNSLEKQGIGLRQRIQQGSTDRLNPIIMTALTSALALIPIAVKSSEPGNEIQAPMAIVILGGLVTSTILNLLIVPIIYYLINKNKADERRV